MQETEEALVMFSVLGCDCTQEDRVTNGLVERCFDIVGWSTCANRTGASRLLRSELSWPDDPRTDDSWAATKVDALPASSSTSSRVAAA